MKISNSVHHVVEETYSFSIRLAFRASLGVSGHTLKMQSKGELSSQHVFIIIISLTFPGRKKEIDKIVGDPELDT